MEKPDTKCTVCGHQIWWNPTISAYVDDVDGMPMCYPPGQLNGNLAHVPEKKE